MKTARTARGPRHTSELANTFPPARRRIFHVIPRPTDPLDAPPALKHDRPCRPHTPARLHSRRTHCHPSSVIAPLWGGACPSLKGCLIEGTLPFAPGRNQLINTNPCRPPLPKGLSYRGHVAIHAGAQSLHQHKSLQTALVGCIFTLAQPPLYSTSDLLRTSRQRPSCPR